MVEKAFAVGAGGIVGQNTRLALSGTQTVVHDVVAGLGGRPITRTALRGLFDDVLAGRLQPDQLHFLDLNTELVQREIARASSGDPGPHAESMLRQLGTVSAESH